MKPVLIIPAYEPDQQLIQLVETLSFAGLPMVIVDDGSSPACQNLFEALEAKYPAALCRHGMNLGKGAALKTGIRYARAHFPEACGYVTADADGQHSPEDILKVAAALEKYPDRLILGTRSFDDPSVPFKSRWGNRITSLIFFLSTRRRCSDTQTGLRGLPAQFAESYLAIPENRYEYEMAQLLKMCEMADFLQVPIATLYLEHNRASHFHAVKDSVLIYKNIFKYSFSSILSAAVDLTAFAILVKRILPSGSLGILAATVIARLISGNLNFLINKHWVFRSSRPGAMEAGRYLALFCSQMLLSWLLVTGFRSLPLPLPLIKVFVDGSLFVLSYHIQKRYIFYKGKCSVQP